MGGSFDCALSITFSLFLKVPRRELTAYSWRVQVASLFVGILRHNYSRPNTHNVVEGGIVFSCGKQWYQS